MMPLPLPPAAYVASSGTSSLKLLADVADRLFAENRREEGLCVIDALYLQADAALWGSQKPCGQQGGEAPAPQVSLFPDLKQ